MGVKGDVVSRLHLTTISALAEQLGVRREEIKRRIDEGELPEPTFTTSDGRRAWPAAALADHLPQQAGVTLADIAATYGRSLGAVEGWAMEWRRAVKTGDEDVPVPLVIPKRGTPNRYDPVRVEQWLTANLPHALPPATEGMDPELRVGDAEFARLAGTAGKPWSAATIRSQRLHARKKGRFFPEKDRHGGTYRLGDIIRYLKERPGRGVGGGRPRTSDGGG